MYDEILNENDYINENVNDMLNNDWNKCEIRLDKQK